MLRAPRPDSSITSLKTAGVVYTRRWTVELILELAGYSPEHDLVRMLAVEPSAGTGSFLVPMVERLIDSCRRHNHALEACASSLLAYEIHPESAALARKHVKATLLRLDVPPSLARKLAMHWVHVGDYLLDAPRLAHARFVIGNPPYIRLEDLSRTALSQYRSQYATMRGRADIYIAFYEAALQQLSPEGVCAFICADRWMSNQYGAALRAQISHSFSVNTLVEMHNASPFETEVAAYPAVSVLQRAPQRSVVVAKLDASAHNHTPFTVSSAIESVRKESSVTLPRGVRATRCHEWIKSDAPWPYTSPERIAVLSSLETRFEPLENVHTQTRVTIGVATGCDRVFITSDRSVVEPSRLLPLAMVKDTLDGAVRKPTQFLVNPWNAKGLVDLSRTPRLRRYLKRHAAELKQRHVASKYPEVWFRTIDRVDASLTKQHKLYVPDIRNKLHPVLDEGKTYPHHNLYVITSKGWDLEVLGGLLLSAVGQFFVEMYGVRMRGGWLRFQAQYLRRIRVPRPEALTSVQKRKLRTAFQTRDTELATAIACEVYGIEARVLHAAGAE